MDPKVHEQFERIITPAQKEEIKKLARMINNRQASGPDVDVDIKAMLGIKPWYDKAPPAPGSSVKSIQLKGKEYALIIITPDNPGHELDMPGEMEAVGDILRANLTPSQIALLLEELMLKPIARDDDE